MMRGNDLIRSLMKVGRIGRKRGVPVRVEAKRGTASHVLLYFGSEKSVIPDPHREPRTGTLPGILKQLRLSLGDLVDAPRWLCIAT